MDLNSTAEMLELAAKELREAERQTTYWIEYAFRLEEKNGAIQHAPRPKRDKTVTNKV